MDQRAYQICSNCVMDTTDSLIVFDEAGVCDHCRTFERTIKPNWHTDDRGRAEADLRALGKASCGNGGQHQPEQAGRQRPAAVHVGQRAQPELAVDIDEAQDHQRF